MHHPRTMWHLVKACWSTHSNGFFFSVSVADQKSERRADALLLVSFKTLFRYAISTRKLCWLFAWGCFIGWPPWSALGWSCITVLLADRGACWSSFCERKSEGLTAVVSFPSESVAAALRRLSLENVKSPANVSAWLRGQTGLSCAL